MRQKPVKDAILPDTPKEFRKGYDDAYEGRVCHPTSVRYLEGYQRGELIAFLVRNVR